MIKKDVNAPSKSRSIDLKVEEVEDVLEGIIFTPTILACFFLPYVEVSVLFDEKLNKSFITVHPFEPQARLYATYR